MHELPLFIQNLKDQACYDHPIQPIRIVETHISWVLLTGEFAYKIKKPVDLGFLNFSTLDLRHFYCREEIRLNQRFSNDLYLGVSTITGDQNHPKMDGAGKILEYAVKMRQFEDEALADSALPKLPPEAMDEFAETLTHFHASAPQSNEHDSFGSAEKIIKASEDNISHILSLLNDPEESLRIARLQGQSQSEHQRLEPRFIKRKQEGFVRECHGDLHLANLAWLNQRLVPFDCIEFNPDLRWIDVISELAFLLMDLETRNHTALASRLLNRYLQITGDYESLALLDYYKTYRALVRAKVSLLSKNAKALYSSYVAYAEAINKKRKPQLLITHGFSGSGKSYCASRLSENMPAIWLRSDIERKRLFKTRNPAELYRPDITDQTYSHLRELSRHILNAGYSVIIDATFLKQRHRKAQYEIARQAGVDFKIVDLEAPMDLLQQRIEQRIQKAEDPSDATLAVLDQQISAAESLSDEETAFKFKT